VTFRPSAEKTIFLSRKGDDWAVRGVDAEFRYETLAVRATIENSLYVDATRLGAPDKVVAQFANIYEYSVDFQRDIQPGDAFELFFEVARDHNGDIVKAGDLLFTSFSPRGKKMDYWLFEDSDGQENFYDAEGETAKRKLRATPINGARLSSSYGSRRHPILGYRKMHSGVDFAAPRGTPILAAGSGVIERANRYGSFGNYVRIRHSDGYQTAYAHMKGFARGIRAGSRVSQDQVIGYVGTTGRSTGPHLHYEVIHNGKKINPRQLSQLSGKPLSSGQMAEFKSRRLDIETLRNNSTVVEPQQPVAVLSASAPNE
jgi:murein DD-endopeptidase MepM/ murein hydrolase activator NlpD